MSFILFLYWADWSREPSHPITQEVLRFSWQLRQPLGSPNGIFIAQVIPSVMLNDLNSGTGLSSKMNEALLLQSKGFKRFYCISRIVGVRIAVDKFSISPRGWALLSVQFVRVIGRGMPGKEVVIWSVSGTCNRSFPQFSLFMPPKHNTWSQMIRPKRSHRPFEIVPNSISKQENVDICSSGSMPTPVAVLLDDCENSNYNAGHFVNIKKPGFSHLRGSLPTPFCHFHAKLKGHSNYRIKNPHHILQQKRTCVKM